MRLSTRSRYGVRLMLALAMNGNGSPIFLKDIARSEDMSEKYLSQIIIPLKASGLVRTFRGAHGGYLLGRPANEITLKDIVEPLEGDLCLVDCVSNESVCGRSAECATRGVWSEMSSLLRGYLDSISLGDLARRHVEAAHAGSGDFSI